MKVKVINRSAYGLPQYETGQAAGLDVRANITRALRSVRWSVHCADRTLCGVARRLEMQVRPRSGLAAKHGLSLVNSPGTVDPDYRGEIKVILVNLSNTPYELKPGERVGAIGGSPLYAGRMGECRGARRDGARRGRIRFDRDKITGTLPDRRSSLLFVDLSGDVFVFYDNIEFLLQ